ncbi:hypothetical protein GWK47_024325 [Chionoecetes opilio]|uniref:PH domain-containing protein n=1 Tax=Chionoecetes opilio TaxID=41210 RepID=A0A8J5CCH9_CHIOP|nr:hypothetical protein GWK47_024325 [Chionoecetes opilio]
MFDIDIPGANQHKEADKAGFLTKLSGRSFPYIAQWKRRYCVLSKGRLYYYEKEDSKAGDKANGVIQLEYFDHVAEAGPKECKKATNVFIITSQDRSFFDPGRHVFSADTLPDMKDWIRKLHAALEQIRNNNRPAASTSPSVSPTTTKEGGGKRRRDEAAENTKEGKGSQAQTTSITTKERRKKKEEPSRPRKSSRVRVIFLPSFPASSPPSLPLLLSIIFLIFSYLSFSHCPLSPQEPSRPGKSSRVGVAGQTQTSMVEPDTCEPDGGVGRPAMAIAKGGVIVLPGLSSHKDPQATSRATKRRSGVGEEEKNLPERGPTLTCVTKLRVKGPQGRRAPQSHRTKAAAALKKRASSLSALEHQDAGDNRSESSEGASRSYRDSQTPEGDLKEETESEEEIERKKIKEEAIEEVEEHSPERKFTFDNIDDGLFFKAGLQDMGAAGWGAGEGEGKRKRCSSGLGVNIADGPPSPSRNGTLGKLLRFRDSVVAPKRSKYVFKGSKVDDHPDMMQNSRWSCVVL